MKTPQEFVYQSGYAKGYQDAMEHIWLMIADGATTAEIGQYVAQNRVK